MSNLATCPHIGHFSVVPTSIQWAGKGVATCSLWFCLRALREVSKMETRVYRNLNKEGYWSLKQRVEGKWIVVGHARSVQLRDAKPYVSEATRQRMIRLLPKRGREVHAWLVGDVVNVSGFVPYKGRSVVVSGCPASPRVCQRITYHPLECGFFYNVCDGSQWHQSPVVDLCSDMSVYTGYVM